MKEVHTKIIIDFNFKDSGVAIEITGNKNGLDPLQKSFVTLIFNRVCDVINDVNYNYIKSRYRDLDIDINKKDLDNILDKLIDDLFKKLEKRK